MKIALEQNKGLTRECCIKWKISEKKHSVLDRCILKQWHDCLEYVSSTGINQIRFKGLASIQNALSTGFPVPLLFLPIQLTLSNYNKFRQFEKKNGIMMKTFWFRLPWKIIAYIPW